LGNVFTGKPNITASAFNADGVINLKLKPVFDGSASPVALDEAYLRAYFGALSVEGGLRKLTWGKADSFGPLDVVNPLDYRDLTDITNLLDRKIARPMIHAIYRIGSFSKLEGVFIPWFEGHRFADAGRWTPRQITALPASIGAGIVGLAPPAFQPAIEAGIASALGSDALKNAYPQFSDLSTLQYAQAGLRFTTTIVSSDVGIQYYFGRFHRPAISVGGLDYVQTITSPDQLSGLASNLRPQILYNRYHQIGLDYAQVIAGFNLRAELAANITEDLAGDDGSIYNPSIAWSLGFDRDLVWGINLNLQAVESIRLRYDNIADNPAQDAEAGSRATATRITGIISKKFLRDELELKVTAIWGVEDRDFFIIPAVIWTKGAVTLEGSAGFLGGDETGELGQYNKNSFVKISLSYRF
jgi:hypothetical protein